MCYIVIKWVIIEKKVYWETDKVELAESRLDYLTYQLQTKFLSQRFFVSICRDLRNFVARDCHLIENCPLKNKECGIGWVTTGILLHTETSNSNFLKGTEM